MDLEIIAPERRAVVAGLEITMREPSWIEAIELDQAIAPVIAELDNLVGADPDWGEMQRILYRHQEVLTTMMALCTDAEVDWIMGLSDTEGQKLVTLFWQVNGPFFARRVRLRRALALNVAARAGRTSSTH